MQWNEIESQIVTDDRNKWDEKAGARQLQVTQAGTLEIMDDKEREPYFLSDLATSQMCQRLEIPVRYYRRLPGVMKSIVANYDLHRMEDNSYLLRGKGDLVRAFLTSRYAPYDNSQIAETVEELLSGADVTVKSFVLEETHMFIKVVAEEIEDSETGLKAGIMVGNSEVGLSSVSVEPFVFRLACTNDLVLSQEEVLRQAHVHLTASELTGRVARAISKTFEVASETLDRFLEARRDPVADPAETIRKLAEERKLSQKFTDEVLSSYQAEPEPNRFGVINAFTAAARQLAPIQRIEMERFAGSLLEARV